MKNCTSKTMYTHSSQKMPKSIGQQSEVNYKPELGNHVLLIVASRLFNNFFFSSVITNRTYSAKTNVSCQSSNLVYCITCKRCGIQYVGQTKRRLMDRFQDHFYKIGRNVPNSDIGAHFNSNGHGIRGCENIHSGFHPLFPRI